MPVFPEKIKTIWYVKIKFQIRILPKTFIFSLLFRLCFGYIDNSSGFMSKYRHISFSWLKILYGTTTIFLKMGPIVCSQRCSAIRTDLFQLRYYNTWPRFIKCKGVKVSCFFGASYRYTGLQWIYHLQVIFHS